ncbi:MAG: lysylphosphatidylglycerol synthase transmembrane domain-containing protein [bacterium]
MNISNPIQAIVRAFVRRLPALDAEQDSIKRQRWPGILLRVVLTGAVIGLLFWQIPWRGVVASAAGMKAGFLLAAILLWIPNHAFQFFRWALLVKGADKEESWTDIFRSYWVGFTLGVITPGRVGQFARCFALRMPLTRAVGASLLERFYATVALNGAGPLALVALILAGMFSPVGIWRIPLLAALSLVGAAVLFLGLYPRILLPVLFWIVRKLPLREQLERIVDVMRGLDARRSLELTMFSLVSNTVASLQFVILLQAMGTTVPLGWGMAAVLANFFFKANLPFSVAGLGIGEWTAVLCLVGLGVPPASAVAGSLVLFAINVLSPALLGIPFLPGLRFRRVNLAPGCVPTAVRQ